MGKSLRSKRKQKLKRERQEKFKVKELKRLKDMLRAAGENVDGHTEVAMEDAGTGRFQRKMSDKLKSLLVNGQSSFHSGIAFCFE